MSEFLLGKLLNNNKVRCLGNAFKNICDLAKKRFS